MRSLHSLKVLPLAVLLVLPAVTTVVALCRTGRAGNQYWDEAQETCRNCSVCTQPGHIVTRPCQVNRDTVCEPLRALGMDWPWLGHSSRNGSHHDHHGKQWSPATSFNNSSHGNHRYFKVGNKSFHYHHHHFHHHHHHHKKVRPPESAAQLKTDVDIQGSSFAPVASAAPALAPDPATSAPLQQVRAFTTPEALVWDWQVVVLALAVFACILFFGAAAGYGVRQARHDACRTADVEDLSAALGLMMPVVGGTLVENGSTVDTSNTSQCLYMEKLLVCKDVDGRGNVYIDRDNTGK